MCMDLINIAHSCANFIPEYKLFDEGKIFPNGLLKTHDNDEYSNYIIVIANVFNLVISNFLLSKSMWDGVTPNHYHLTPKW